MTIKKGEEWGTPIARPSHLPVVASDAALARAAQDGTEPLLGLGGGDLHRSLGSPQRDTRQTLQRLEIDALLIELDGDPSFAVAHVIARRGWWRGPLLAVMNCDHLGSWNVAPRAHPNDGRFDVVEVAASMPLRARWEAHRRLPAGTHVPHPDITVTTGTRRRWRFDPPMGVWVDGVARGRHAALTVTIAPDRLAICV